MEQVSISAAAERLLQLDNRAEQLRDEMFITASKYGRLTQELLVISEAIKLTIADLNGGKYPEFPEHQRFESLNHEG